MQVSASRVGVQVQARASAFECKVSASASEGT